MNHNDTFYHPTVLFSAAHHFKYYKDLRKTIHLDKDVFIFIDSGGFQLATGALIESPEQQNPNDKKRDIWNNELALAYSELNGNVFPILDRPVTNAVSSTCVRECLDKTKIAAQYYLDNRTNPECSILNVLSARNEHAMEHWYSEMKDYDFEGWAHGGTGGNLKVALKGVLFLLRKGEFDKDQVKYHHIFGISGMSAMVYFSFVQELLNKMDVNIQLTFDSSYFQRQLGFGGLFLNPKWTGMGLLNFTNKGDYSKLSESTPLPCDCAVCKTVPSVKAFMHHPMNLYMKGLAHNLLLMDRIKFQAETIFEIGLREQWKVTFGTKIYENLLLLERAFNSTTGGMELIDKMTIRDLESTPVSLESLF